MRRILPPILLLFAFLSSSAEVATAAIPSAANSTQPGRIHIGGTKGGVADPANAFVVTVRDLSNNVIAGSLVEVRFGACADLFPSSFQPLGQSVDCVNRIVSATTDFSGVAQMNIVGAADASLAGSGLACATIWADGVPLGSVQVSAWDLDGVNGVDYHDIALWLTDFYAGVYVQRSDHDFISGVGANDLSLLLCMVVSEGETESGAHCDLSPVTTPVLAGGQANLDWGDCGSPPTAEFACNTNTGAHELVASFVPPGGGLSALVGFDLQVRLMADVSSTLPSWWQFENAVAGSCVPLGGCRSSNVSASLDFSSLSGTCDAPFLGGSGLVHVTESHGTLGPNLGILRVRGALATPVAVSSPGTYYLVRIIVNHARTTGAGACAGCAEPLCIDVVSARLLQSAPHADYQLSPSASLLTWNGAPDGCATPARATTWGQVKALYR